eukprot:PLAT3287.8.p1 GENE.PLAT3287.8~~PLAT3287.8.p1  ORF type:complete len:402 (+),score=69.10 PLAT3287.8:135-1340(+)
MRRQFRHFVVGIVAFAAISSMLWTAFFWTYSSSDGRLRWAKRVGGVFYHGMPEAPEAAACRRYEDCLDVTRCSNFTVTLWPPKWTTPPSFNSRNTSGWFRQVAAAVRASPYFVEGSQLGGKLPCLFVPHMDHSLVVSDIDYDLRVARWLRRIPEWQNGQNWLLFNQHDDFRVTYDQGSSIVAKVGWGKASYRSGIDISLAPPIASQTGDKPLAEEAAYGWHDADRPRRYLATFRGRLTHRLRHAVMKLNNGKDILVDHPNWPQNSVSYRNLLLDSTFVLAPRGNGLYSYRIVEALHAAAIPVVIASDYVLPFEDVLDWRSFAVLVSEAELERVPYILRSFTPAQVSALRTAGRAVYHSYFASVRKNVDFALDILRYRLLGTESPLLPPPALRYSSPAVAVV